MPNILTKYRIKFRDAIILSLIIHAIFFLFLVRERERNLLEKKSLFAFQKDSWDKNKSKIFIYPNTPPGKKVIPKKDAPYSDANRSGKSSMKYKTGENVKPKIQRRIENPPKPKVQEQPKTELKKEYEESKSELEEQEIKDKGSLAYNKPKGGKDQKGPSKQELYANPSKYLKTDDLIVEGNNGNGSSRNYNDKMEFGDPETMKHECWGNYPERIQSIVRNNMDLTLPRHIFYSKGKTILRFKLFKDGHVEELKLYKSTGNELLDKVSSQAIKSSKFPPYDCDFESVNVQYTFYLNYEENEIEDMDNN
jgi:outer membrane biosynthesis protein TonB